MLLQTLGEATQTPVVRYLDGSIDGRVILGPPVQTLQPVFFVFAVPTK